MLKRLLLFFFILTIFLFIKPASISAHSNHHSFIHTRIFHQSLIAHILNLVSLQQTLGIQIEPTPTQLPTPTYRIVRALNESTTIIDKINAYRLSHGLNEVTMHPEVCAFAALRAQEIILNFTHDGFNTRTNENTLPYSSWSKVTENIAMTTNPQEVVDLWANSPGHAENMRADTPFVCIQRAGDYYAYEGMKP